MLLVLECFASRERLRILVQQKSFAIHRNVDFQCELIIGEAQWTAPFVLDQVFRNALGKIIFLRRGEFAQFRVVGKGRSVRGCARRIDCLGLSLANSSASWVSDLVAGLGSPFFSGLEVPLDQS